MSEHVTAHRPAPLVRRSDEHGIAVLTLDSPHNRNALSERLMHDLGGALAAAAADPGARAGVLCHSGEVFFAGSDLSEASWAAAGPGGTRGSGPQRLAALLRAIVALPKPVVARVDGHVRAGGLGLVGACDIAVA